MSKFTDPYVEGLARGWQIVDASALTGDRQLEADVVIVGTGAGGGVTAETLCKAGLKVVLLEEGPLKTTRDFKMRESEAYPSLYQESAARQTKDKGISILQGRTVGGSTTVNWTSSFRTPPDTLTFWQKNFGLKDHTVEQLQPWFEMMERRLHVQDWLTAPNANNNVLKVGAEKLGISWGHIRRNINGCWNLGYCGMGCPTNAKQSMLITTIPFALQHGATLVHHVRAHHLLLDGDRVLGVECQAMDQAGVRPGSARVKVKAPHVVLSAGAIGSPALLLRSKAPDPYKLVGSRTFLHPTTISMATMPGKIDASSGAPQSLYSDHFLHTQPVDGDIGFKIEVPPLHPLLASINVMASGEQHAQFMSQFQHVNAMLSLLRDGFHPQSTGGQVELRSDDTPVLDYKISEYVWQGVRHSLLAMGEMQFAAGATMAMPAHDQATPQTSFAAYKKALEALPMEVLRSRVVSAHVMGGCRMGSDPKNAVINADGQHHHLRNLHVIDGSMFPTSIGANPQLSIYGIAARNAAKLALQLTGKPVPALA
jgi:choline dehydrogenase-like flavoprotein